MYVPSRYSVDDASAFELVEAAGAGFIVVATGSGLRTVFAPVVVADDRSSLHAHVARGNPLWSDADDGDEVVALFKAADAYVSPSLYPGKAQDPRVAPSWDYDVVEVRGVAMVRDDARYAERVVRSLTERHESRRESPWSVDDAPADFVAALVRGIVGLEIAITSISAAAKLSQNKSDVDRAAVRAAFEAGSDRERALASRMARRP